MFDVKGMMSLLIFSVCMMLICDLYLRFFV